MALALVACRPPSPDLTDGAVPDDGPPAAPLVAGARVLATQSVQRPEDPGPRIVVADAVRDGARIVVLTRANALPFPGLGTATRTVLFTSEDRGATFREQPVTVSPTRVASRVIAASGRIALVLRPEGGSLEVSELGADGTLGAPQVLGSPPLTIDGAVATAWSGNTATSFTVSRFDLSTGSLTMHTATTPARTCTAFLFDRDADSAWRRVCFAGTTQRCVDTIDPEAVGVPPVEHCFPYAAWPVSPRLAQEQVGLPSGLWFVHNESGHAFARRLGAIDGATLAPAVDLGTGRYGGLFAGLLHLVPAPGASGGPRLVDLRANGSYRDLAFPETPCVDPSQCEGWGTIGGLARLLPLDPDGPGRRWLALYVVDRGAMRHELVAREVGEDEAPVTPISDGGASFYGPIRGPIEATSEIETACARALTCHRGRSLVQCVLYWTEVVAASSAQDPLYQRFVSIPAGDCEGFRAAAPELFGVGRPACADACIGDTAWQCTNDSMSVRDCARLGTTCRITASGRATCGAEAVAACGTCDAGRAVVCAEADVSIVDDCSARGLSCQGDVNFGEPGCTTGRVEGCTQGSGVCDGAIAFTCSASEYARKRVDCGRVGLGCRGGACETPSPVACDANGMGAACEGTLMTYCLFGEPRFFDCASIGATRCEMATALGGIASAHCAM